MEIEEAKNNAGLIGEILKYAVGALTMWTTWITVKYFEHDKQIALNIRNTTALVDTLKEVKDEMKKINTSFNELNLSFAKKFGGEEPKNNNKK